MTTVEVPPLGAQLTQLAASHGERPALITGDEAVSFLQLEHHANRLARAFARAGLGAGDVLTVGLPNGPDFVAACFAAWKVGAIPQPVSHRLPLAEQQAILELAKPRLVVGLECEGPWARVADLVAEGEDDSALAPVVSPRWKIMTSGGSTGRPKLIAAASDSRQNPESGRLMGLRPGGVVYSPGPMFHNTPFSACVQGLVLGSTVVLSERFAADCTVDAVERHHVEVLMLVPTMMSRISTYLRETGREWDTSSLTMVWHAAAKCPDWLKRDWIDLVGPDKLFEIYGGTELVSVTVVTGREWLERPGTVGKPLLGEMRVCDEEGVELPRGAVGEIYMRSGDGMPLPFDYIGADAKVRDGWITVGDLGWMDEDGFVFISDRRTDMVVSGGQNVYPAEVEGALERHPGVLGAVVVGLPDPDLGQRVHAVVQVAPGTGEDELRAFLAAELVRYKQPRSYHLVTDVLRDDAGKVRRSAWRDAETERLGLVSVAD
jgi:bile acid-coenzyme A ligase